MQLNEQQKKVVNHINGPCLVTACPGSGKTRTITERAVNLIRKGVPQENLLCLTFTNKASKEMASRIKKALNVEKLNFYVGTFHTFCAIILRKYGSSIGYNSSFTILDDDDQETLIKKIIKEKEIDPKSLNFYNIKNAVNHYRENLESDEELFGRLSEDDISFQVAKDYLETIKERNCIDFSGLLYETVKLFEKDKPLLEKYQEKFKYIQVDECQDANLIQFHIINMISEKYKNTLICGDISQSIYRFRNARYQNILDFLDRHKDCIKIPLGKNYRSTPEIVKVADKLIRHNKSHMGDKFETDNPSGSDVSCRAFENPKEEADYIASEIKYLVRDCGWKYSDASVLYRINSLSLDLQMAFSKYQIPFTVVGGPSFFDRAEIRDCLSMLKFLSNPEDHLSFARVVRLLNGVGNATINKIEKFAKENKVSVVEICKNIDKYSDKNTIKRAATNVKEAFGFDYSKMHAGDCLVNIINKLGYNDLLEKNYPKDFQDRAENIKELINNATAFGQSNKSIEKYLQNIALVSSSDKEAEKDSVVLGTFHSSKGLEWPIVFVCGLSEGVVPHSMAISECGDDKEKQEEAIEEERRCIYVALSRAMKHLFCSYSSTKFVRDNKGFLRCMPQKPSRFLFEAGLLKNK